MTSKETKHQRNLMNSVNQASVSNMSYKEMEIQDDYQQLSKSDDVFGSKIYRNMIVNYGTPNSMNLNMSDSESKLELIRGKLIYNQYKVNLQN